jgi:hypothetical protein
MRETDSKGSRPHHSTAQAWGLACAIAGFVLFQLFARDLFPPLPGGETNWDRNLATGVVAVLGGVAGVMIGSLIDRLRH